jgi:hypothetical protein
MNEAELKKHNNLCHTIADEASETVEIKELLRAHWDETFSYMHDMNLDELVEIATDMGIEVE